MGQLCPSHLLMGKYSRWVVTCGPGGAHRSQARQVDVHTHLLMESLAAHISSIDGLQIWYIKVSATTKCGGDKTLTVQLLFLA